MNPRFITPIAAAIAVALQIFVAPIIAFSSVVPNFLVAFVVVLAIIRPADSAYVYAFVLGLISDLLSQVPLGLTSLLLLIITAIVSHAFQVLDKSTPSMPLIASLACTFAYELLVAVVLLCTGYQAGFFELLLYRVLPGAVYNFLICVLCYFLSRKFTFDAATSDVWAISKKDRFR